MATGLAGIFSGIDSDVLVNSALAKSSGRLNRLTVEKTKLEYQSAAIDDMANRMSSLEFQTSVMNSLDELRNVVATTSDGSVAYVSTSVGMGEGTYSIEVDRLASAEKEVHAGLDSTELWLSTISVTSADDIYISADDITDSLGGSYMFEFQFGSEPAVSVDLSGYSESGITLSQLAGEINMRAGYGAAEAVDDAGEFKLQLLAQSAGSGRGLIIGDTNAIDLMNSTDDFDRKASGDNGMDAIVGAGQFVYTYNGITTTVTTTQWTTLGDLTELINDDNENPGVAASILGYAGVEGGEFHMVLTGKDSGSDYGITIEASTSLAAFSPDEANWTEIQTAQDSRVRVDGYPVDSWIERSGNVLSDVIPGGKLTLASTGETTITLTRSANKLAAAMENLVNVLNGVALKMAEYTGYDDGTGTGGVLQGDYFLGSVFNPIRSLLSSRATGFVDGEQSFTMMSQIGIEINKEGEFTFDSAVFNAALETDYDGVMELVGVVGAGSTSSSELRFIGASENTAAGSYDVQVDYDASGNITAGRVKMAGRSEYQNLEVVGNSLIGKYGTSVEGMEFAVAAGSGVSETKSYEVTVRQGLAGQINTMLQDVVDSYDGMFVAKQNSFSNTMGTGSLDLVKKNMLKEQDRLVAMEERLLAKYARLEATLANLQAQSSQYEALFSSIELTKANND